MIVSRRYWNSQYPSKNITKLNLPVQYVLLTQTNTDKCMDRIKCVNCLNSIQKHDLEVLAEPDIIYNFVVGGEGRVYEGRGWYNSTDRKQFGKDILVIAFSGIVFDCVMISIKQLKICKVNIGIWNMGNLIFIYSFFY